ncbi:hypothetical protein KC319_g13 [Hortaea werneckii]|nr:hypothetical protein KC319_g13 [Hortaea werneckii]
MEWPNLSKTALTFKRKIIDGRRAASVADRYFVSKKKKPGPFKSIGLQERLQRLGWMSRSVRTKGGLASRKNGDAGL